MTRAQIADPRLVELVPGRDGRTNPAMHPVQPGLPRAGQPQPHRELRGRARERARDRRAAHRAVPTHRPATCWWSARGRPGSSAPGSWPGAATGCGLAECTAAVGGRSAPAAVGPGRERLALLPAWLESECRRLGGHHRHSTSRCRAGRSGPGRRPRVGRSSWPPGSRRGRWTSRWTATTVVDAAHPSRGGPDRLPEGPVVVHDPSRRADRRRRGRVAGGSGRQVALVTPDQIAGTLLSLSGDLADANTRLQRAGVRRELRARFRRSGRTGKPSWRTCGPASSGGSPVPSWSTAVTGCPMSRSTWPDRAHRRAGDCVAPSSVLEAVLEGRRRALEVSSGRVGNASWPSRAHA